MTRTLHALLLPILGAFGVACQGRAEPQATRDDPVAARSDPARTDPARSDPARTDPKRPGPESEDLRPPIDVRAADRAFETATFALG